MKKVILIAALCIVLCSCGNSSISTGLDSALNLTEASSTAELSTDAEEKTELIETQTIKPNIDESKPEVKFADLKEPRFLKKDGSKYFLFTLEFYNKSDTKKKFTDLYTVHVLRNGNELDLSDYELSENLTFEVLSGTSKQIDLYYEVDNYDMAVNETFSIIVEDNNVPNRYVINEIFQSEKLLYSVYENNGDISVYMNGEKRNVHSS